MRRIFTIGSIIVLALIGIVIICITTFVIKPKDKVNAAEEYTLTVNKVSTISVYVSGQGVKLKNSNLDVDVYTVEENTEVIIRAINESRIFQSWVVMDDNNQALPQNGATTSMLSFVPNSNMNIATIRKDATAEDYGRYMYNRFLIEIYLDEILETAKIEIIEDILTKVLKEKIVLNDEASVGKRLNFLSEDKYIMAIGKAETTKSKSKTSGDSNLSIRLKDGKYLVAISDGMGSGKEAKNSSLHALRLLENLLLSGFDKKISLDLINTALLNQNNEIFATLDIAIVDLYKGNIEFIKSGACPTYIKNKKRVQMIKSTSLPTGIIEETTIQTFDKDIEAGDIMLMCSDGILDSNIEYKNKELWIKYMLEDVETSNTQKIADLILNEAIDNNYGVAKDDMSIIVCKFRKKEE